MRYDEGPFDGADNNSPTRVRSILSSETTFRMQIWLVHLATSYRPEQNWIFIIQLGNQGNLNVLPSHRLASNMAFTTIDNISFIAVEIEKQG